MFVCESDLMRGPNVTYVFSLYRGNISILDITDTEADDWLSGQLRSTDTELEDGPPRGDSDARAGSARPGRLHLLLGDSIARDSGLKAGDAADEVLHRALGGATWASTLRRLPEDLAAWRSAAATFGMDQGPGPGDSVVKR